MSNKQSNLIPHPQKKLEKEESKLRGSKRKISDLSEKDGAVDRKRTEQTGQLPQPNNGIKYLGKWRLSSAMSNNGHWKGSLIPGLARLTAFQNY